jgi:branched-chain amino acid transport system ATP-binding protein
VTAQTAPVLELESVTMQFGGITAVKDVSLTVGTGARWAVIGPNGAGKTTLFRVVSGEHIPTEGRVRLFGSDVTKSPPYRRAHRGLGRTYQVTEIFGRLTVTENVTVAAQATTRERFTSWRPVRLTGELAERVDEAIERVQLTDRRDHVANELSHGEQRQLELALALASRPRLLLLDEPAAGLSAAERMLVAQLIRDLPDELSLILIEHDMNLALGLVERVLCLDNGEPIAEGTPDEIRANEQVQAVYLRSE